MNQLNFIIFHYILYLLLFPLSDHLNMHSLFEMNDANEKKNKTKHSFTKCELNHMITRTQNKLINN